MAATATDYFTEVGTPGTATTLAAPGHSIAGTSFTVVSTSGWPTNTGVVFAVDNYTLQTVNGVPNTAVRTAGTYTEWEGVVASSTSITGAVLRYGTDQNYSAGSLTRVYIPVASSRENRLVQGLAIEHGQDGKHTTITTTGLNDTSGNELIKVSATASAVNELTVTNAATGNAPQLSATGNDTNIDVKVTPKGTGRVVLNGAGIPTTTIVAAAESTASTSYTDLTTPGPAVTVTIGASGMALVIVGANKFFNTSTGESHMGFAVSGASTVAAADNYSFGVQAASANLPQIFGSAAFLVTGLTAGSNTFTAKYRATAGSAQGQDRRITVLPL